MELINNGTNNIIIESISNIKGEMLKNIIEKNDQEAIILLLISGITIHF